MNIDDISAELKKHVPDIIKISDMHVWEITSNMYSFTAHVQVSESVYAKSKAVIDAINRVLTQKYGIEHTTIQVELPS